MEAYKKVNLVIAFIVALVVIPLIIYFFFIKQDRPRQVPVPPTPGQQAAAPTGKVKTQGAQLPVHEPVLDIELNSSDEPLRELLQDCSSHPEFARWLESKDLIRRGVAIVNNIADGVHPAAHLEFLLPTGKYSVIKRNGKIVVDPLSYIRYQPAVMTFVSIETEKVVEYYRQLQPVIEEAYKELGYPGKGFNEVLEQALAVLLETPILEGDIYLEEKVRTYAFADPRLESLDDVRKLLLRMGPENTRKIREKLREIATALKLKK